MGPGQELCTAESSDGSLHMLEKCKQQASDIIEHECEHLHRLSQDIWREPELAYQEHRAHHVLTSFFSSRSWQVQPHYQLDTAFRAEWTSSPSSCRCLHVAFLCEYDALPELGHACGHNLIAEVGAAGALGLRAAVENMSPLPQVKITVLGTPAEEEGGGKVDLIKAGAFEDIDIVFMAHPAQDDAAYLPDVAVHDVTVKYYGKASHAAAYPWEGINALDAAVLAYNNLSVLRQQMKPTWRVHGIIKHGGVKPNIIPSYTELEFYLRAPSAKDLADLGEKANACFKAAADSTGCTVELCPSSNDYSNVLPNKILAKAYIENGKKLGMQFTTDDQVLNALSGSTDFGNVTFEVPGIHPYFFIGSHALNHTEEYTKAAGSKEAQFYTLRTAKALAMTALDVIFKPELLESVREEWKRVKQTEEMSGSVSPNNSRESSGGASCASC